MRGRARRSGPRVLALGGTAAILLASVASIVPATPTAAATPSARAIPATALLDREIVELRGRGYGPGTFVGVWQCAGKVLDTTKCAREPNIAGADATGAVSVPTLVRRVLTTSSKTHFDCASAACFLVVSPGSQALPISFVRNAPLVRAALPVQPPCVAWPTTQWPTGPIPPGVDASAVSQVGTQMIAQGATAVVVIQGGRVVYEKYADKHGPDTIEPSFSMSKSFTSTVIGLLVQQGKLQLDARAPIKEWAGASDSRRAITLRNILNMSSGLQWNEIYANTPDSDVWKMINSPDEAAYVIKKPLAHTPGTVWHYSTGDTAVLGRIISRTMNVSGSAYSQFLHKVLFDPLGINPVNIGFDQSGDWMAGWFTNMSTRNFAKLGLLYLRNGGWGGSQLLSSTWVEFVRTPSPASAGYGGQFWLEPDGSFEMIGLYGQTVHIVPQSDLIVAVSNGGSTQAMVDLFRHAVSPSCGAATPKLTDDHASVPHGGSVDVPVLANDSGGAIGLAPGTLTVANPPTKGTATVNGSSIHYAPKAGATGADHFTYVVCTTDRRQCPEASVSMSIT